MVWGQGLAYRIERQRNSNAGFVAGLFGCLFGLLGIFTIGLIFVPLAALCAVVGILRGIIGGSMLGMGTSLLAGILAGFGVVSSPSLWLVLAGGIIASNPPVARPTPALPPPSVPQQGLNLALQKRASSMAEQPTVSPQLAGSTCYMGECFEQQIERTSTEANGSIRVLVKVRNYEASQPQVTLGQPTFATFWVSCRSSGGYIENEEHVRLPQPNPQPSHATEPGDKLWNAVCSGR